MHGLDALERGELQPPASDAPPAEVVPSVEVARLWAVDLGLKPGNTMGPTPAGLVPVVDAWARARGMTGPGARCVGKGLAAAGLRRRSRTDHGSCYVALAREDAARLWALARAAWAPALPPRDRRAPRKRRPREYKPEPPTTPRQQLGTWAEELRRLPRHLRRPVCDSTGRVWPSPAVVARALGGNRKALDNAMRGFREALHGPEVETPKALLQAMRKGGVWRGRWWRYLTPEEVQAIPPTHPAGTPLPGYGWGLSCACCGGHATYPTADLPPRPW